MKATLKAEINNLLTEYRAEIARLYGKDIADKSIVDYDRGWFRIGLAAKYKDGSVGSAYWHVRSHRKQEMSEMLATLKSREPNDQTRPFPNPQSHRVPLLAEG